MDSISSNIIRGIEELKAFFYEFGKKIAPPGVNPYCNDDCMELLKKPSTTNSCNETKTKSCNQTINCQPNNNIEYAKAPYNPTDINTYINCLDTLVKKSTVRDTASYDDFNIKVFQTFITSVKVTKFNDDEIDELNVTRTQPYYNPLHLMLEILKIDTKLFNILYLLNLHNSCRSPITGVYYGKIRTKINDNGFPVVSDVVSNTDIHNATIQMVDLLSCILKLITFIDIDSYNKIIEDHFSINSVGNVTNAEGMNIIISDSASDNLKTSTTTNENIPTFLYGQLLSFCDASRQAIQNIPLESFTNSPQYNASKVANIAYNCTYGLMGISQIMENLLKSRCFAIVMSMLFPSGKFHSAPEESETRDFGPRFKYDRDNDKDLQSITRIVIDGVPLDMTKVVPPKSIPNYLPSENPIAINKAVFCTIITALCGISRFLWNSNAPCLSICTLDDDCLFNTDTTCCVTTTQPPTRSINSSKSTDSETKTISTKNSNIAQSQIREPSLRDLTEFTTIVPPEVDGVPESGDLFSIDPLIKYLQDNTYASVLTSNGKIFTCLQTYISAFAGYDRAKFNDRITQLNNTRSINTRSNNMPINKSLYSMLTRGINF
jgi:hypothetical protein